MQKILHVVLHCMDGFKNFRSNYIQANYLNNCWKSIACYTIRISNWIFRISSCYTSDLKSFSKWCANSFSNSIISIVIELEDNVHFVFMFLLKITHLVNQCEYIPTREITKSAMLIEETGDFHHHFQLLKILREFSQYNNVISERSFFTKDFFFYWISKINFRKSFKMIEKSYLLLRKESGFTSMFRFIARFK